MTYKTIARIMRWISLVKSHFIFVHTSPRIELINDDFPDPMAPATPTKFPGQMDKFISRNTCVYFGKSGLSQFGWFSFSLLSIFCSGSLSKLSLVSFSSFDFPWLTGSSRPVILSLTPVQNLKIYICYRTLKYVKHSSNQGLPISVFLFLFLAWVIISHAILAFTISTDPVG